MSARAGRAGVTLALVLMLASCAFEAPVSTVPAEYDFGPPPAYQRANPSIPGIVLVAPVRAPAWLTDDGIVYRLLYEDAGKPQSYAMSRWAGEPASLIGERLSSRLAAATQGVVSPAFGARSDYTLRIELEDFSQHFKAPGEARALLRARATLLGSERRVVLAQRVFDYDGASQPNAAGAVKALSEATDTFLDELLAWIAATVREQSNVGRVEQQR